MQKSAVRTGGVPWTRACLGQGGVAPLMGRALVTGFVLPFPVFPEFPVFPVVYSGTSRCLPAHPGTPLLPQSRHFGPFQSQSLTHSEPKGYPTQPPGGLPPAGRNLIGDGLCWGALAREISRCSCRSVAMWVQRTLYLAEPRDTAQGQR